MKFSASIKPEYFETFSSIILNVLMNSIVDVIAAQNKLSDKLCFILENKTIKICSIEKDRTLSSFCDINPVFYTLFNKSSLFFCFYTIIITYFEYIECVQQYSD